MENVQLNSIQNDWSIFFLSKLNYSLIKGPLWANIVFIISIIKPNNICWNTEQINKKNNNNKITLDEVQNVVKSKTNLCPYETAIRPRQAESGWRQLQSRRQQMVWEECDAGEKIDAHVPQCWWKLPRHSQRITVPTHLLLAAGTRNDDQCLVRWCVVPPTPHPSHPPHTHTHTHDTKHKVFVMTHLTVCCRPELSRDVNPKMM